MYPALDEELEDEQCLPLTGVSCGEIDEALRSLSESAREGPVKTFEQTRKVLKQVVFPNMLLSSFASLCFRHGADYD